MFSAHPVALQIQLGRVERCLLPFSLALQSSFLILKRRASSRSRVWVCSENSTHATKTHWSQGFLHQATFWREDFELHYPSFESPGRFLGTVALCPRLTLIKKRHSPPSVLIRERFSQTHTVGYKRSNEACGQHRTTR